MKTLAFMMLFLLIFSMIKYVNNNENKDMNLKKPDLIFSKINQNNVNLLILSKKQKKRLIEIKYKVSKY